MLVPTEDGRFVSERHAHIDEIINDYDPNLRLAWIPPENRDPNSDDPPFAIIDTRTNEPIMFAREDEVDERLLARLWRGDNTKHNVLRDIEAQEAAQKALALKERMDREEEAKDFLEWYARSPWTFTHNGKRFNS